MAYWRRSELDRLRASPRPLCSTQPLAGATAAAAAAAAAATAAVAFAWGACSILEGLFLSGDSHANRRKAASSATGNARACYAANGIAAPLCATPLLALHTWRSHSRNRQARGRAFPATRVGHTTSLLCCDTVRASLRVRGKLVMGWDDGIKPRSDSR